MTKSQGMTKVQCPKERSFRAFHKSAGRMEVCTRCGWAAPQPRSVSVGVSLSAGNCGVGLHDLVVNE